MHLILYGTILYSIKEVLPTKSNAGFLMSRIRHLGNRAWERYLTESGIDAFNGAQGRILYVLWENGGMTITEIGRQTSLAKTTLTSMLDRMEQGGLIRRIPGKRDRRQIHIELTERALSLRGAYDDISERTNDLYYEGFTEAELSQFEGYLHRIIVNLEKDENERLHKEDDHAENLVE